MKNKESSAERTLNLASKRAAWKVDIAQRLRKETSATLKWIAVRSKMGAWTHVSHLLYHTGKAKKLNANDRLPLFGCNN